MEKEGVMSWSSTLYLEAVDVRIISQDKQRHSLWMKILPSLAVLDNWVLSLTQQHIFLTDDWFFWLCKRCPNDQANIWLQNKYFIPYWANHQHLPRWGLTSPFPPSYNFCVLGMRFLLILRIGSDVTWMKLLISFFRQKHNLAHCSWVHHIHIFLPLDTRDFPAGGLDVAVFKAVLYPELEAWGEGECYLGLRIQTGRC